MKRTVCDSSARENFTGCSAGVALQPCGSSSFTDVSAGPVVSLRTVTRISRSGVGAPLLLAARRAAARAGRASSTALRPRRSRRLRCASPAAGPASLRIDDSGTIATCGVTRTENAGTTSSSLRFSPLKMSPS